MSPMSHKSLSIFDVETEVSAQLPCDYVRARIDDDGENAGRINIYIKPILETFFIGPEKIKDIIDTVSAKLPIALYPNVFIVYDYPETDDEKLLHIAEPDYYVDMGGEPYHIKEYVMRYDMGFYNRYRILFDSD